MKKIKDEVNKCKLDKDSNNKNLKEEIMKNKKLEDIIKNLENENKKLKGELNNNTVNVTIIPQSV